MQHTQTYCNEVVAQRQVDVLPTEEGVPVGGLHLEHAPADLQQRDIERAAAQVEHRHLARLAALVEPVGQRGRCPGQRVGVMGGGAGSILNAVRGPPCQGYMGRLVGGGQTPNTPQHQKRRRKCLT